MINQYTPVTDVSGKISRILYLAHDITRYKKSEEESAARASAMEFKEEELQRQMQELSKTRNLLEENENIVESIYKAIDIGQLIIELDNHGNIIKINNLALQLFKLADSEIVGKYFMEVFNSDKTDIQFTNMMENLKEGLATTLTGKYILKDKSVVWLNEIYAPLIDTNNKTIKILILANNITQQKELEDLKSRLLDESNKLAEELQKKQKEFEENALKLSGLPSGIDQVSSEKIKTVEALNTTLPFIETDLDLNVISVNRKFSEMFKYAERELINKHLSRILPVSEKEVLSFPSEDYKEGEPIEIQIKIQSRDRQIFPVSLNMIPFNLSKKGLEKILIYISGGDFGISPDNGLKIISDELEMKKIELKQITERIERLKNEKGQQGFKSPDDSEELYNRWLQSLKTEHNKK